MLVRHPAGMGRTADAPDPDRYEHQYAHCDVLVVGGGAAGLAAARAAARMGARVIVCQQSSRFGGGLLAAEPLADERRVAETARAARHRHALLATRRAPRGPYLAPRGAIQFREPRGRSAKLGCAQPVTSYVREVAQEQ